MKKKIKSIIIILAVTVMTATVAMPATAQPTAPSVKAAVTLHAKNAKKAAKRKTGIYKAGKKWKYFKNGKFQKKATGLVKNPVDKKWSYVVKGVWKKKTGVVKRLKDDGKKYFILKGIWVKKTGVAKDLKTKKLVYVKKGIFTKATGAAKRISDGKYLYVQNGTHKKVTGIANIIGTNQNIYISNGSEQESFTGVAKSLVDGKQYVVSNGSADATKQVTKTEVTDPATCTEDGTRTYTLADGTTYTETIKKAGHDYTSEVTTPATCIAEGVKTYTCKHCGNTYTEVVKKTAHRYTSTVTKPATCEEAGERTCTCSICGDSYVEPIAQLSHSWEEKTEFVHHDAVVVPAHDVVIEGRYATHTCCYCGADITLMEQQLGVAKYLADDKTLNPNYDHDACTDILCAHQDECGYGGYLTKSVWIPEPYTLHIDEHEETPPYDDLITYKECVNCGEKNILNSIEVICIHK